MKIHSDDQKYEQIQKALRRNSRKISEPFQTEITSISCLLLPMSLSFCLVGLILCLMYEGRYCKESDPGKWMGNYSTDCDGSYMKSQTMQVTSSFFAALL